MKNVRSRLLKGAVWLSGARLASNILATLGTLVLARLLLPSDFGLVALGTTTLNILTSVTNVSLSEALVQHRDPSLHHFHTVWTINLLRGLLIGSVFALIAVPVARYYSDYRLENVMFALSGSAILNGLENPRAIMLTKQLIFWQQFMLQVSQKLVTLIASVLIALIYHSYWALIGGILLGQFVGVLVSYTVLPFRPAFSIVHVRELFSFSIWLTLCQAINTINWNFDQLLVGKFIGKTTLGYYAVGNNLAAMPSREATAPLTGTLFPAFSNLAHDPVRLATAYQRAQSLVTAVALPAGVGMAVIADPLVRLTMGERWLPAVFVIRILAAVFAFQTLGSLAQPLAMAAGRTQLLFKRDLQAFLYRVPLVIVGLYFGGFAGILYARAIMGTTGLLFNTNVVTTVTGLSLWQQLRPNIRAVASVLLMAAVLAPMDALWDKGSSHWTIALNLGALIAAGAVVYCVVTFILWRVMGRPEGAETEVMQVVSRVWRSFVPV
ncbi:MAG TPA: lipopolysaccharide biosynthesis protein [Steroidobacteraceae bacterium]|nr:lipopolysaccharide biosynthesis protein [Steroidobacteraceae bacterium]